jgi:hypothetical protein
MARIAFRNKAYAWTAALHFWFAVFFYSLVNDEIRLALTFLQVFYGKCI